MKKFRLPYGIRDYLPEECYRKNNLEQKVSEVFYRAGFEKVGTGALEYYDLYDGIKDNAINRMFKLTDSDGSLLVLRPDTTLQISRMAATKLTGRLQKLFYIEKSYEFLPDIGGKSARTREFSQIGIEILGKSGVAGDIETVMLAIDALKASGLDDFLIDIGHIGFINGILADSGLSETDAAELKRCINQKDALGTEMLLGGGKKLNAEIKKALTQINTLYGGAEVLKEAAKLASNAASIAAVERLRLIISALESAGLGSYVSVDLGLIKGGYYSGLIVRGLTKHFGGTVLDGGRYDFLGGAFGKEQEAVGFAIGTDHLLSALEKQGTAHEMPRIDAAYINTDGFSEAEFCFVEKLRAQGFRAVKLYETDKKGLTAYCKEKQIKKAYIFTASGSEEIQIV